MDNIVELKKNIERLNKSSTLLSKKKNYGLVQKSIQKMDVEFESAIRELASKNSLLEQLKKENLVLKQDYVILNDRVQDILKEKSVIEGKLVKAFSDSLDQMDRSMNGSSSRVDYRVSAMNIKLKTNIAVQGNELRFQLPKADVVIPANNLSELEFTIHSFSKDAALSNYVDVPDVLGLEYNVAVSTLRNAGFVLRP